MVTVHRFTHRLTLFYRVSMDGSAKKQSVSSRPTTPGAPSWVHVSLPWTSLRCINFFFADRHHRTMQNRYTCIPPRTQQATLDRGVGAVKSKKKSVTTLSRHHRFFKTCLSHFFQKLGPRQGQRSLLFSRDETPPGVSPPTCLAAPRITRRRDHPEQGSTKKTTNSTLIWIENAIIFNYI